MYRKNRGFTLVELLVVIAIIVVLVAILYPVFQSVRERARETQCIANLNSIAVAVKAYRQDFGRYPTPPYYSESAQRYFGGISALFPSYITDTEALICPSDRTVDGIVDAAKSRVYSTYNGVVESADPDTPASWHFRTVEVHRVEDSSQTLSGPARVYNYFGYGQEGYDVFNFNDFPYASGPTPQFLSNQGLRLRHYPRLANQHAPGNTYITHCTHHRDFYNKEEEQLDTVVNLDGSAKKVNVSAMSQFDTDVSKWVKQTD